MLIFFSFIFTAALVAIDQLTKALAVLLIKPMKDIPVIEGWLYWSYRENTGAAFSMFSDDRYVFLISTTILMGLCLYLMLFKYSKNVLLCFTFSLVLGGGFGNMIDRLAMGYVVDFIHVPFFPAIFNFADCCITVGGVLLFLLILYSMFKEETDKKEKARKAENDAAESAKHDADAS